VTTYCMGYSLIPPVIKSLLIANGAMFLAELISRGQLIHWLALWPLGLSYASPVPGGED
jgi:hypothetical protein